MKVAPLERLGFPQFKPLRPSLLHFPSSLTARPMFPVLSPVPLIRIPTSGWPEMLLLVLDSSNLPSSTPPSSPPSRGPSPRCPPLTRTPPSSSRTRPTRSRPRSTSMPSVEVVRMLPSIVRKAEIARLISLFNISGKNETFNYMFVTFDDTFSVASSWMMMKSWRWSETNTVQDRCWRGNWRRSWSWCCRSWSGTTRRWEKPSQTTLSSSLWNQGS